MLPAVHTSFLLYAQLVTSQPISDSSQGQPSVQAEFFTSEILSEKLSQKVSQHSCASQFLSTSMCSLEHPPWVLKTHFTTSHLIVGIIITLFHKLAYLEYEYAQNYYAHKLNVYASFEMSKFFKNKNIASREFSRLPSQTA